MIELLQTSSFSNPSRKIQFDYSQPAVLCKIYNSQRAHIPQKYIMNINFFKATHTKTPQSCCFLCACKLEPCILNVFIGSCIHCLDTLPEKAALRYTKQTINLPLDFDKVLFYCALCCQAEAVQLLGKDCRLWALVNLQAFTEQHSQVDQRMLY